MKIVFPLFFAGVACIVLGCSTSERSANLYDILAPEIKSYGGRMPVSQDGPTPPVAHWTRTQDRFGTVLETSDMTFQQVDQFLTGAFGKPNEAGNTAEGQMQWVIPAKVAGVSIWYRRKVTV